MQQWPAGDSSKPFIFFEIFVGAVGIEHDPLFLSPATRWRRNRLSNPIAVLL